MSKEKDNDPDVDEVSEDKYGDEDWPD